MGRIRKFGAAWLLGIVGGGVCGAVLTFVFGIGEWESTPAGFSSVSVYCATLGLCFGSLVGALVVPLAYPWFICKIGLWKAFWPAMSGALAGGFLGFLFPPLILPLSILFLFGALDWSVARHSSLPIDHNPH
jgi:hypothetical protein